MKIITKVISIVIILVTTQFLFSACGTTNKKPIPNENNTQNQSNQNRNQSDWGSGPTGVTP